MLCLCVVSPQYSPLTPMPCSSHTTPPQNLGVYLATALARLHVNNLSRSSSLEAGRKREKKGGEERRNVRNSV
jgi:hypothetical protein